VDTLGHLLALRVTPANEQDREQVAALANAVQQATGTSVELAYVDQGYTGERAAEAAKKQGIQLEVVKLGEAKPGFVLLPRRWVVERSFAWAARFRRLAKDYERLPTTVAGLHFFGTAWIGIMRRSPAGSRCLGLRHVQDQVLQPPGGVGRTVQRFGELHRRTNIVRELGGHDLAGCAGHLRQRVEVLVQERVQESFQGLGLDGGTAVNCGGDRIKCGHGWDSSVRFLAGMVDRTLSASGDEPAAAKECLPARAKPGRNRRKTRDLAGWGVLGRVGLR
jgi:transposase